MRSMVTLEHDGGEVQSRSSRATVAAALPLSSPGSSRRGEAAFTHANRGGKSGKINTTG